MTRQGFERLIANTLTDLRLWGRVLSTGSVDDTGILCSLVYLQNSRRQVYIDSHLDDEQAALKEIRRQLQGGASA